MVSEQDFAELENALFRAGKVIVYPATPPLAAHVRATLEAQSATLNRRGDSVRAAAQPRAWSLPRWSLAARVALATAIAVLLALAVLLVSPETREAVAQFFGLRTIKIIYVTPTPVIVTATPGPTATPKPSTLCCETTLQDAQQRAHFDLLLPPNEQPSKVYFQNIYDGQQVVLVFGDPQAPRYTLYQAQVWIYQKVLAAGGFGKQLSPGTMVDETQVRGRPAIWFSGAPHVLVTLDRSGQPVIGTERPVFANTLAWESGDNDQAITYRLETGLAEVDAKRLAESFVTASVLTPTPTATPRSLSQCC